MRTKVQFRHPGLILHRYLEAHDRSILIDRLGRKEDISCLYILAAPGAIYGCLGNKGTGIPVVWCVHSTHNDILDW